MYCCVILVLRHLTCPLSKRPQRASGSLSNLDSVHLSVSGLTQLPPSSKHERAILLQSAGRHTGKVILLAPFVGYIKVSMQTHSKGQSIVH